MEVIKIEVNGMQGLKDVLGDIDKIIKDHDPRTMPIKNAIENLDMHLEAAAEFQEHAKTCKKCGSDEKLNEHVAKVCQGAETAKKAAQEFLQVWADFMGYVDQKEAEVDDEEKGDEING